LGFNGTFSTNGLYRAFASRNGPHIGILEDGAGTSNIFKRIFLKPSIWFYTSYYMTILRSVSMYPDCPIVGQQRYKVADFRSETRYQDFPVFSVFWATHNVWR